ncbi:MAG: hypothetical protein OCD01_10010 [Fibrobacterales bacterium]
MKNIIALILLVSYLVFPKSISVNYEVLKLESPYAQPKYITNEKAIYIDSKIDTTGIEIFDAESVVDFMNTSVVSYMYNDEIFIPRELRNLADTLRIYTKTTVALDPVIFNTVSDSIKKLSQRKQKIDIAIISLALVASVVSGGDIYIPHGTRTYDSMLKPRQLNDSLIIDMKNKTIVSTSLKVSKRRVTKRMMNDYGYRDILYSSRIYKGVGDYRIVVPNYFLPDYIPKVYFEISLLHIIERFIIRGFVNNIFESKFTLYKPYYSISYQYEDLPTNGVINSLGGGVYWQLTRYLGVEVDAFYNLQHTSLRDSFFGQVSFVGNITIKDIYNIIDSPADVKYDREKMFAW